MQLKIMGNFMGNYGLEVPYQYEVCLIIEHMCKNLKAFFIGGKKKKRKKFHNVSFQVLVRTVPIKFYTKFLQSLVRNVRQIQLRRRSQLHMIVTNDTRASKAQAEEGCSCYL